MNRTIIKILLVLLPSVAFGTPCWPPKVVESEIPDASIYWEVTKDDVLGTHYLLNLEKTIEGLNLDHLMIYKKNHESLDFHFSLSFSETWQNFSPQSVYLATGFSINDNLKKKIELVAIYKSKAIDNCDSEVKKYRFSLAHTSLKT